MYSEAPRSNFIRETAKLDRLLPSHFQSIGPSTIRQQADSKLPIDSYNKIQKFNLR